MKRKHFISLNYHLSIDEIRRPGLGRIIEKVQSAHPSWSTNKIRDEAKRRYHNLLGEKR